MLCRLLAVVGQRLLLQRQMTGKQGAHFRIGDPEMRALLGRHLALQGQTLADYREQAAEHLPFRRDLCPPSAA